MTRSPRRPSISAGSLNLRMRLMLLEDRNLPSTTLYVDHSGTYHGHFAYPTISAAVTAAHHGDEIDVAPGTYIEQVTIPAGKDGLTLHSINNWQAVIQAPAVMTAPNAIVRVNGAHDVTIDG